MMTVLSKQQLVVIMPIIILLGDNLYSQPSLIQWYCTLETTEPIPTKLLFLSPNHLTSLMYVLNWKKFDVFVFKICSSKICLNFFFSSSLSLPAMNDKYLYGPIVCSNQFKLRAIVVLNFCKFCVSCFCEKWHLNTF